MSLLSSLLLFLPSLKEKSILQLSFDNEVSKVFTNQHVASVEVLNTTVNESAKLLEANVQYISSKIEAFDASNK